MIDLVFRPFAGHVHVGKPVGFVFLAFDLNYDVSIFVIVPSSFSNRATPRTTLNEVVEPTIIGIIEQDGTEIEKRKHYCPRFGTRCGYMASAMEGAAGAPGGLLASGLCPPGRMLGPSTKGLNMIERASTTSGLVPAPVRSSAERKALASEGGRAESMAFEMSVRTVSALEPKRSWMSPSHSFWRSAHCL